MDTFRLLDRKSKNRIKQLETELETATKRNGSSKRLSDRLYSPYNKGNTPTNSLSNNRRAISVPTKNYSPANRINNRGISTYSKGSFNNNNNSRNPSSDALKNNKMSPSYNYNFRK